MVNIDSPEEEIVLHDFAISNKQQIWIGMYAVPVGLYVIVPLTFMRSLASLR